MPETPLEPTKPVPTAEGDEAATVANEVSLEMLYDHQLFLAGSRAVPCCFFSWCYQHGGWLNLVD